MTSETSSFQSPATASRRRRNTAWPAIALLLACLPLAACSKATSPPAAALSAGGYRVYRGSSDFEPSAASLVAQVTTTSFVDAAGAPYGYRVTAIDAHGNESMAAAWNPVVEPGADIVLRFAITGGAAPSFALDLPRAAQLRIAMFDVTGREAGSLAPRALPAGSHRIPIDAARLASGVYFGRAEIQDAAGSHVRTARVVRLR